MPSVQDHDFFMSEMLCKIFLKNRFAYSVSLSLDFSNISSPYLSNLFFSHSPERWLLWRDEWWYLYSIWKQFWMKDAARMQVITSTVFLCFMVGLPLLYSLFFFASYLHVWTLLSLLSILSTCVYLAMFSINHSISQSISSLFFTYLKTHCVLQSFEVTLVRKRLCGLQEKILLYLSTCVIPRLVTTKNEICQHHTDGTRMTPAISLPINNWLSFKIFQLTKDHCCYWSSSSVLNTRSLFKMQWAAYRALVFQPNFIWKERGLVSFHDNRTISAFYSNDGDVLGREPIRSLLVTTTIQFKTWSMVVTKPYSSPYKRDLLNTFFPYSHIHKAVLWDFFLEKCGVSFCFGIKLNAEILITLITLITLHQ